MNAMIFNPLEEYEKVLKAAHSANAEAFFQDLAAKSKVDVEENRKTVAQYDQQLQVVDQHQSRAGKYKVLRVLLIIAVILLPLMALLSSAQVVWKILGVLISILLLVLLFWKLNPHIKKLNEALEQEQEKAQQLLDTANSQMAPLNALFGQWDAVTLIEKTIPWFSFNQHFPVSQELDMLTNYDFAPYDAAEESVLDVLSGTYNGNPFLYELRRIHTMGEETYHGYKTIRWTERYTDSKGHRRTRTRSQTLHATVIKPKPFYHTETKLHYGAQGGPELTFNRENKHLEDMSQRAIDRMVRKGEKELQELAEDALEENRNFTGMTNTEFDVLFDALDRDHEVQFRTLFTPLAQTNMVDLLRSETGYGDDFDFFKRCRMNTIVSEHTQQRSLLVSPQDYCSHSFDLAKSQFLGITAEYFKAIYFDFAPLLAIPIYQERPVHSLHPIPDGYQPYPLREYESLANAMDVSRLAHEDSKTLSILKAKAHKEDSVSITAHSYDTIARIDTVMMLGGDGRMHGVPVPWDEYIPLTVTRSIRLSDKEHTEASPLTSAYKHGLYGHAFH